MAFTVTDFQDLVRLLSEHPEWRAELRPLILTDELLRLPEMVARMDVRLTERLDGLTERMDALTERMDTLATLLTQLASEVRALVGKVDHIDGRMGNVDGGRLESWLWDHAASVFGRWLRPIRRLEVDELADLDAAVTAGLLSAEEVDSLRDTDLLVGGRERQPPAEEVVYAVEVSTTMNVDDVNRAEARAEILRRAGYHACGWVAGYRANANVERAAKELGVRLHVQRPKRDATH